MIIGLTHKDIFIFNVHILLEHTNSQEKTPPTPHSFTILPARITPNPCFTLYLKRTQCEVLNVQLVLTEGNLIQSSVHCFLFTSHCQY